MQLLQDEALVLGVHLVVGHRLPGVQELQQVLGLLPEVEQFVVTQGLDLFFQGEGFVGIGELAHVIWSLG